MYLSDYGYATSGGTTKDRAACLAKGLSSWLPSGFSDCAENDYLNDYLLHANYKQWTLTLNSADAVGVFVVYADGGVVIDMVQGSNGVRPALFLKSNILVDKGTGAKSDPYTLKMQ